MELIDFSLLARQAAGNKSRGEGLNSAEQLAARFNRRFVLPLTFRKSGLEQR